MRLDKFLSLNGLGSRNEVKALIKHKRIRINDSLICRPEDNIDPNKDHIYFDDEEIIYKENYYFLLNKPKGYLSSTEDKNQLTVIDLLPEYSYLDLFPVGRLDKDTTGALILTTDGELCHKLISPKYHVDKVYIATLDHPFNMKDKEQFEKGILLDNELTLPAKLEKIDELNYQVTLHQGKYHQVKRMFEYFNNKVIELNRIKFSFLTLKGLEIGSYRELTTEEIEKLKKI